MADQDSKFWFDLKEESEEVELRCGIDDELVLGVSLNLKKNRAIVFSPTAETRHHLSLTGDPEKGRITFHETIEDADGNINAMPALVLSVPYLKYRLSDDRFCVELQQQVERACRFIQTPSDFRAQGIHAIFPVPIGWQAVTGTRYEIQLATSGPQPTERLWRSTPGTPFLAIGENFKMVGLTTLLEDERAVLIRYHDVRPILSLIARELSEPSSPPIDIFTRS